MKALYKVILSVGIIISIVICLWSIIFYIAIIHEIDDETEDSLELYAFKLIQKKNEGKLDSVLYDGSNNSFFIEQITKQEASQMENMSFEQSREFLYATALLTPAYPAEKTDGSREKEQAEKLNAFLKQQGLDTRVESITFGPAVNRFELNITPAWMFRCWPDIRMKWPGK